VKLRDYQDADVNRIRDAFARGRRRVVYQAPTGCGKTVLFVYVAGQSVALGRPVAIVVHRIELVDQTCEALAEAGIEYGVVANGFRENPAALVQVCMVRTLANRSERLKDVGLLVLDEAHHVVASTWAALLAAAPNARVLGTTATPMRLDGKGLGAAFDELIVGPSVRELIDGGWLSRFAIFAPAPERAVDLKGLRTVAGDYALGPLADRMSSDVIFEDVIKEFDKHLRNRSALAFCPTLDHSCATARMFRANGVNAVHLDGDTPAGERRETIARLGREPLVITNCGLISEGLNVPVVGGIIMLRPTKSLGLYLQQIGRALRPAPGKDRAIVLDHASNVFRHGFPDTPREWSLADRPKQRGEAPVKRCASCGALIPASARECPECGAAQPPQKEKPRRPGPATVGRARRHDRA
jgi:superfamily II DNA or RNA helicase